MIARYFSALGTGSLMTFSLLYVMQMLISLQPGVVTEAAPGFPVDWIGKVEKKAPPPPPTRTFERETILNPPLPPPRHLEGTTTIGVTTRPTASASLPATLLPKNIAVVDGPLVNLIRVKPVYPGPAARKGLEGYVIVRFDVLADGHVANVSVIESSNRVFEASAIRATKKFRFRPRVVDGVAQVSTGIQNLFRFEMEAGMSD